VPKSELSVKKGNECHIECALSGQRCVRGQPGASGSRVVRIRGLVKCARFAGAASLKLVQRAGLAQAGGALRLCDGCNRLGRLKFTATSCDPAERVL
jgi:hypothetical protein